LRRDARGRLHSADAAAVKYPDGWSVYAWHGVRVAEAVILRPETMTVDQIQEEPNAEVRRVKLERFGGERMLAAATAINIGSNIVDVSSVSTIGAICVAAVPDEAVRRTLYRQGLVWGLAMTVVGAAACWAVL
jgi:hypothetical protein